jgi:hypothetical protein
VIFVAAFIGPAASEIEVLPPPGLLLGIVAAVPFDPELLIDNVPPELAAVKIELEPIQIEFGDAVNEIEGRGLTVTVTVLVLTQPLTEVPVTV